MGFTQFIRQNARWLIAGALLTLSSSFGQTFFISVYAGEIMQAFDLTNGQWGGIYSLGTLVSALVLLWAGALSDRFRAKTLGSAFLILLALACWFIASIHAVWMLPVAIFALRFTGQGMLSHISAVAISRWFSATRGKALAVANMGFAMGEAMLPLMFVSLLAFFDWRSLWLLSGVLVLTFIPVLRSLLRTERSPKSIAISTGSTGMAGRHWMRKQVVQHWLFWAVLPVITAPSIFSTALFFQQVHLVQTKGWSHAGFVALFPMFTVVAVAATLVFGWAIDKWGCARLMPFFSVPMALAYFIFSAGETMAAAALGFALMGIMIGGAATLNTAFWSEFYGTENLGAIKSMATSMMVFGSAVGPGLTGWLIDRGLNFPDQMYFFGFYILAVCALTFAAMRRVTRENSASAAA